MKVPKHKPFEACADAAFCSLEATSTLKILWAQVSMKRFATQISSAFQKLCPIEDHADRAASWYDRS